MLLRSEHDLLLTSVDVGPIPLGVSQFTLKAPAPEPESIPSSEILGVTVILLTALYDGREFVRVGYYVNNEYTEEELAANPPARPVIEKVRRNVLAAKPRVTRFAIKWDSEESAPPEFPPDQPEADAAEDDEAQYGAEEAEEDWVAVENVKAPEDEDAEMEGIEGGASAAKEDDDAASEAGSEDLEADSSGSEGEEEEEEEGEAEGENGDEDMEMIEDDGKAASSKTMGKENVQQQAGDVMIQ